MQATTRWTVVVDIESGNGCIRAVARLHQRHTDRLVAVGAAGVHPAAPAAAVRLAAEALTRLGHELHLDVERIVRQAEPGPAGRPRHPGRRTPGRRIEEDDHDRLADLHGWVALRIAPDAGPGADPTVRRTTC